MQIEDRSDVGLGWFVIVDYFVERLESFVFRFGFRFGFGFILYF